MGKRECSPVKAVSVAFDQMRASVIVEMRKLVEM
jgi:hypothetical protein